jgi:arylsulfatase
MSRAISEAWLDDREPQSQTCLSKSPTWRRTPYGHAHETMNKPMNVLWICSDQQRWDTLGCSGNPFVRTPHLDGLARSGVNFEHAYCQTQICSPSRGSFLTGRYPRTNKLRANGQTLPASEVLIGRLMAEAGYRCGLQGKLHLAPCHRDACGGMERRLDDGYHVFDWSHHPSANPANDHIGNAYSRWLMDGGVSFASAPVEGSAWARTGMDEAWHHTTWCTDRARSFIASAEQQGHPWFCSLNYFDPHHLDPPRSALAPYLERLDEIPLPIGRSDEPATTWQRIDRGGAYGGRSRLNGNLPEREHRLIRAAYWAMCDFLDAQVGRVLRLLEESGARERTLVIYTSDHGEMLGDHGIYLKGPHFFDPVVRVPLIISGPGVMPRASGAFVELVDVAPTICDLAGVAQHPGMQGRSLAPLLHGHTNEHRDDAFCEFMHSNFTYDPPAHASMVRTRTHKLVRYHGSDEGELYDLQRDPEERRNLWQDSEATVIRQDLLLRLMERMAQTLDPLPVQEAAW